MNKNIVPHTYKIDTEKRKQLMNQNALLVWFTGLSGSGKSTIANRVEQLLFEQGVKTYVLDGDNIRKGINRDLSFAPEDRSENIRRIAEIAALMLDAGLVVLGAFVSPYKSDRKIVADIVNSSNFVEIFVDTSLAECENRDVKGLYKKAREGKINNMTGISAPYEKPDNPDIIINTERLTIDQAAIQVVEYLEPKLKFIK